MKKPQPAQAAQPAKPRPPRLLLAVLALAVLLALAHTALWFWGVRTMEANLDAFVATQRAQGWTVEPGTRATGGWPMAIELALANPAMAADTPDLPAGFAWKAERVVLSVALLHPRTLTITPQGQQSLRLNNGPVLPYETQSMVTRVALEPGAPPRQETTEIAGLRMRLPAGALTVAKLRWDLLSNPNAAKDAPAVTFNAEATQIGLPAPPGAESASWPLGQSIAALSASGALTGPLSRVPGLSARAAAWRDGGGKLDISRFSLAWGPLDLSGHATLGLDDRLQPSGAGELRATGQNETLDALAANRVLPARAAQTAKAVLALMARTPQGGGPPAVEMPLTLQDRALTMGRIPLLRLPELVWPDVQ